MTQSAFGDPAVATVWRLPIALLLVALLAAAPGCGLTLDTSCQSAADCGAGSVCDPTGTCVPAEGGMARPDGGGGVADAGPGRDGGATDAGPPLDAPTCSDVDLDGDGFSDCTGDCDDGSAFTYPGAPETCGDGVTNDCLSSGAPDSVCGGMGTFVAEPPTGNDSYPGTQTSPVATIGQGMRNAMAIGGGVDVYVSEGFYAENVTMVPGISLWGGYEASAWLRDPRAHITIIGAGTHSGVVFPAGVGDETYLDGFTVDGQVGPTSSAAITLLAGAGPVVSNNIINAGDTSAASYGVDINPANVTNASIPRIEGNQVNMGQSAPGWGVDRGAWGIRARQTTMIVSGNDVALAGDDSIQRGIEINGSFGSSVVDSNVVRGTGRAEGAIAVGLFNFRGSVTHNDLDPGSCRTWCTGLALGGDLPAVQVVHNVVFGGRDAANQTAALSITYEGMGPPGPPDVLVHSNFFSGGESSGRSAGIYLGECPMSPLRVGRMFNNVIHSGTGAQRFGVLELHRDIDPEAFAGNALHVNTSSGGGGVLYQDEGLPIYSCVPAGGVGGSTLSDLVRITGTSSNLVDDCDLVDPRVDGDFHLSPGSTCIDRGVSRELPSTDYEGDPRPAGGGPDIGVDEAG